MNKTDKELLTDFFQERDFQLLFGKPIHTCAEPRREFWMAGVTGFDSPQMVMIANGKVYAMRDDAPVPLDKPFANADEVALIRGCTSFDF